MLSPDAAFFSLLQSELLADGQRLGVENLWKDHSSSQRECRIVRRTIGEETQKLQNLLACATVNMSVYSSLILPGIREESFILSSQIIR